MSDDEKWRQEFRWLFDTAKKEALDVAATWLRRAGEDVDGKRLKELGVEALIDAVANAKRKCKEAASQKTDEYQRLGELVEALDESSTPELLDEEFRQRLSAMLPYGRAALHLAAFDWLARADGAGSGPFHYVKELPDEELLTLVVTARRRALSDPCHVLAWVTYRLGHQVDLVRDQARELLAVGIKPPPELHAAGVAFEQALLAVKKLGDSSPEPGES